MLLLDRGRVNQYLFIQSLIGKAERRDLEKLGRIPMVTASPQTNNLGFRGFDSSMLLISRGGIPWSRREFPKNLDPETLGLQILSYATKQIG